MTQAQLETLLKSDESYRIERTVSTSDMDKFQEAICAFSNDLPGSGKKGYLLIGVTNEGEISGLKVDDKLMIKISSIRSDGNILPLPVMTTEKITTNKGDVLIVEVTPSYFTPVRYRGRVFVRIGPRKDIASIEEERILTERCTSAIPTYDAMPCKEATIDDLDVTTIKDIYLPHAIDEAELSNDNRSLKEQLASLRLYNLKYDCPTMASIILFGKNPKYFMMGDYIQFVRFEGTDSGSTIINQRNFKGGLISLLPRLESFIEDAISNERPVTNSLFREKNVFNYPHEAIRELMMNAVMHRDYQSNTPIRFYQYTDRIEIMNAGGLYGNARPDNFPTVNDYRNPIVAEGLRVMRYVNKFNRGINRVQRALKENGSNPAVFNTNKLTVFEVVVDDANSTNLKRTCNELETLIPSKGKALIMSMNNGEYSAIDLQYSPDLKQLETRDMDYACEKSRPFFRDKYLVPILELKLIERTIPDKPRSSKQKYYLTELGLAMREFMTSNAQPTSLPANELPHSE